MRKEGQEERAGYSQDSPPFFLSREENEDILVKANKVTLDFIYECFGREGLGMEEVIKASRRYYYARFAAEELMGKDKRGYFTTKDMEELFSVTQSRQRYLLNKGISPARLTNGKVGYSREAAKETLNLSLLMNYSDSNWKDISSFFNLEKKNFPYWSLHNRSLRQELGVQVDFTSKPSEN